MTSTIDPAATARLVTREIRTGERDGAPTKIAVARRTYATERDEATSASKAADPNAFLDGIPLLSPNIAHSDEQHRAIARELALDIEANAQQRADALVIPMRELPRGPRRDAQQQPLDGHQRQGEGCEADEHRDGAHGTIPAADAW